MKTRLFVVSAVLLAIGMTAHRSGAQCVFQHPKSAKEVKLSLVQAFIQCNACVCVGGRDGDSCTVDADCSPTGACFCRAPNTTTMGGVPSCQPPLTFNEQTGPPANGWTWGPRSSGSVSFRAIANKVGSPLNAIPNTADVAVKIDLRGIEDAVGPVDGSGAVVATVRFTAEGRTSGDQTVIDVPISFSVPVREGRARVRTSFNAFLNSIGQPGLPGCTSLELVQVVLEDENGRALASPGIFLPDINPNL
jgi:hypothetical protein